ncbi:MFS transporter [Leptolyngbya sp. FACHB-17]|uniref:MFS transporter n=1 Tax=unclassified Leptolyngbya TaxID=2650499 RepID=UPI0016810304|nr:MFS transporter [Leptolyngbya sp. FACHB-17]MBD2081990.1 MFS transporter [Leptolyngbya sp. FACHB-17]
MRTFLIIWLGQLVSTFGSRMTSFAIQIWAWELTGQATALALVGFFSTLPSILVMFFAGMIIDRWNRKWLLIIGDAVAALSTLTILCLFLTHQLQLWQIYILGAIEGIFVEIQTLAHSASISLLVPKSQYGRASSLNASIHYGAIILAPALAGALYAKIGLAGIAMIDLIAFVVALVTVLPVQIPQLALSQNDHETAATIWHRLVFGFRYIVARPGLRAIVVLMSLFWLAHDLGGAVYAPLILARTGNDAQILGTIASAAGLGGMTSALILSTWGGPKSHIHGVLLGMVGAGLSKTIFGLARMPLVWYPAQFCSSLNFPLLTSSEQAIWLAKVNPDVQGRVLATRSLILQIISASAMLIAGPLVDRIFEPIMMSNNGLTFIFGNIVGTGRGAGVTLFYGITSLGLILVGLGGYAFSTLRHVERMLPHHDATPSE